MTAVKDKERWWGISRKRWEDERVDDLGDRGPWEDQDTLSRTSRHDAGNTTQLERPDGSSTGYRYTGGGWRVIEGSDTPSTTDASDPHRGTLQQNATNWRGSAGRWRRRLADARAAGDEEAAAQAQDEAATAERIAEVIERYPHVKVMEIGNWTYDPVTRTLDDGGLFEHQLPSPEAYREHAEHMRAISEVVETGDPLRAAAMRNQAEDWERKADDKEADAALNAAVDDFEKAASGDTFGEARAACMQKPNGDAYLTCADCDGRGCQECRGWGWTTHPDACSVPATGHPCTSCVGKVGCVGPEPTPPAPSRPAPPAPKPPPTSPRPARSGPTSGASMSGSIGDAAAGIRGACDIAGESTGLIGHAIEKLEEAKQRMMAAAEGSAQADVGEAMGLFERAIACCQEAQGGVSAAQTSATDVAGRL